MARQYESTEDHGVHCSTYLHYSIIIKKRKKFITESGTPGRAGNLFTEVVNLEVITVHLVFNHGPEGSHLEESWN